MSINRKKWKVKDRFTTGFEMEMFTLDSKGKIAYEGQNLIDATKKAYPEVYVTKEPGKHMLEIGANPDSEMRKSFGNIIYALDRVWEMAAKRKLLLYPFATYPGKIDPQIHSSVWYDLLKKVWGEDKFKISGLCTGFHFHYAIESQVFKKGKGVLSTKVGQEHHDEFMGSYNFLIAADPATTTFMQSSPFIQGRYLAKDSRMIFYRGRQGLGYDRSIRLFHVFRGLQDYIQTVTDLKKLVERRYDLLKSQLIYWGFDPMLIKKYARRLDIAWNPVKINKHGTYEQRGMDMNVPSYALATSMLINLSLRRIVEDKLTTVPSDIGTYRPFSIEGSKLYVPPISIVQERLQYSSAAEGLSNTHIYRYCKALFKFATNGMQKDEMKLLTRIQTMLSERKTMSDRLLDEATRLGYGENLKDDQAANLAERWSYEFLDDIEYTKRLVRD